MDLGAQVHLAASIVAVVSAARVLGLIAKRLRQPAVAGEIVAGVILGPTVLSLGGCRTRAETGSLIGAGAGALGGYMIGNEMDK